MSTSRGSSLRRHLNTIIVIFLTALVAVAAAGTFGSILVQRHVNAIAERTGPVQLRVMQTQIQVERLSGLLARFSEARRPADVDELHRQADVVLKDLDGDLQALTKLGLNQGDATGTTMRSAADAIGKQSRNQLAARENVQRQSREVGQRVVAILGATDRLQSAVEQQRKQAQVDLMQADAHNRSANDTIHALQAVFAKLNQAEAIVTAVGLVDNRFMLAPNQDRMRACLNDLKADLPRTGSQAARLAETVSAVDTAFLGAGGLLDAYGKALAKPADAKRLFKRLSGDLLSQLGGARSAVAEAIDPLEMSVAQAAKTTQGAITRLGQAAEMNVRAAAADSAARDLSSASLRLSGSRLPDEVKAHETAIRRSLGIMQSNAAALSGSAAASAIGETRSHAAAVEQALLGPKGMSAAVVASIAADRATHDELARVLHLADQLGQASATRTQTAVNDQDNALQSMSRVAIWLPIVLLVVTALSIVVGVTVSRHKAAGLSSRIENLTSSMHRLAEGETAIEIPEQAEDELGTMADALQVFKGRSIALLDEMGQRERTEFQLRQAIASLATVGTDILTSTQSQVRSVHEQADALRDVATTIAGIHEHAITSAAQAGLVRTRSEESVVITQSGMAALSEGLLAMEGVDASAQGLAKTVQDLATRVMAVDEIVNTVDEIARQTNLLALNAAIEAGHGDAASAGFSVIATEIKSLALQSRGCTEQVRTILGTIGAQTSQAVTAAQSSQGQVATARARMEAVSQSISKLEHVIEQANDAVGQISRMAGEQVKAISHVNTTMYEIEAAASSNTTSIQDLEKTVGSLHGVSDTLLGLMGLHAADAPKAGNSGRTAPPGAESAKSPRSTGPLTTSPAPAGERPRFTGNAVPTAKPETPPASPTPAAPASERPRFTRSPSPAAKPETPSVRPNPAAPASERPRFTGSSVPAAKPNTQSVRPTPAAPVSERPRFTGSTVPTAKPETPPARPTPAARTAPTPPVDERPRFTKPNPAVTSPTVDPKPPARPGTGGSSAPSASPRAEKWWT